jgi:hypothetical protein
VAILLRLVVQTLIFIAQASRRVKVNRRRRSVGSSV